MELLGIGAVDMANIGYTFDSEKEGWTVEDNTYGGVTYTQDGSTGSPSNGCLKVEVPGGGVSETPNSSFELHTPDFWPLLNFSAGATISFWWRVDNNATEDRDYHITWDLIDCDGAPIEGCVARSGVAGDEVSPAYEVVAESSSGWQYTSWTTSEIHRAVEFSVTVVCTSDDGDFDFYLDTFLAFDTVSVFTKPQSIAKDDNYIYITTWEDWEDWDDPELVLKLYSLTNPMMQVGGSVSLGLASALEVDSRSKVAYVYVDVWDSEVLVHGRMEDPEGLTGVQHIIKLIDIGV